MRSVTAELLAAMLALQVVARSGQESTETVTDSSSTTPPSLPTTTTAPMPSGRSVVIDTYVGMAPGSDLIAQVSVSAPHEHLLVGLDVVGDDPTRLGFVDVAG